MPDLRRGKAARVPPPLCWVRVEVSAAEAGGSGREVMQQMGTRRNVKSFVWKAMAVGGAAVIFLQVYMVCIRWEDDSKLLK